MVVAGVVGAAVAAVLALFLVGLMNAGTPPGLADRVVVPEAEREPAPDLTLSVLAAGDGVGPVGTEVSLSELRGRTVVLNVWASWCGPCEAEAPVLERVARGYRAEGPDVLVLGLDIQDLRGDALEFIDELGLTYPSLRDAGDGADRALRTTGVPETFLIDAEGRIAMRHVGPVTEPAQLTGPVAEVRAGGASAAPAGS